MSIRFRCPSCKRMITAPARAAGRSGKCPGCGQSVGVPSEHAGPPEPRDNNLALEDNKTDEVPSDSSSGSSPNSQDAPKHQSSTDPKGQNRAEGRKRSRKTFQKWLVIGVSVVVLLFVSTVGVLLLSENDTNQPGGKGAQKALAITGEASVQNNDDPGSGKSSSTETARASSSRERATHSESAQTELPAQEKLRAALVQGDVHMVNQIMMDHPELREAEMFGCGRPLHWAAMQENAELVRVLLKNEADPSSLENRNGHAPLHLVARRRGPKRKDTAGVANLLISAGADVNARDDRGETPLHEAVGWNNAALAETLLNSGANVNICDKNGHTPLDCNCEPDVAALIREYGALSGSDLQNPEKGLWEAIESGDPKRVQGFLKYDPHLTNSTISRGRMTLTPLQLAVTLGKPRIVAILLDHGAAPDVEDDQGRTARDFAASHNNFRPAESKQIRELLKQHVSDKPNN